MRFVVTTAAGALVGYLELGMVVVFGTMIIVALGFIMKDVQDQSPQFSEALKGHGELQEALIEAGVVDVQGSVEELRREMLVMARAMGRMGEDLARLNAVAAPSAPGPWYSKRS